MYYFYSFVVIFNAIGSHSALIPNVGGGKVFVALGWHLNRDKLKLNSFLFQNKHNRGELSLSFSLTLPHTKYWNSSLYIDREELQNQTKI